MGLAAPILMQETGATLLPIFTLRQPDGLFRILVEDSIPLSKGKPRIEAAMAAVEALGERIERHARAEPGQWNWWFVEPLGKEQDARAAPLS